MFSAGVFEFVPVTAIFFLAGAVKGVLGMGLPTVAMGLLGLVMPVAGAAALLTVPSLVTNVWQAVAGASLRAVLRRLATMQLGIVCGVLAAPMLLPGMPEDLLRRLLGACLVAYAALGLLGPPRRAVPAHLEPPIGFLAGAATGVITGLTGVFVLPAVPYLQALRLDKQALTQALGVCFTTSTLALALMLSVQGHLNLRASIASLAMVLPAVAGMWLGQAVRGVMSEALFRRCFVIGLLLLGAWLALR